MGHALAAGNTRLAEQLAADWSRRFPGGFYIELQRAGHPGTETYIREAVAIAAKLELPVVATHPISSPAPKTSRPTRPGCASPRATCCPTSAGPKDFTEQQYFPRPRTRWRRSSPTCRRPSRTTSRSPAAAPHGAAGQNFLPLFPTPEGMSLDDFLIQEAKAGLEERLVQLYPQPEEREQQRQRYEDRLKFETDTIIQMGFPGYFLIVADFIQWGKANGVPVGPSGLGCRLAGGLFAQDHRHRPARLRAAVRALPQPERVSMPDFDIDFCQDNRYRVIEYVRERYGRTPSMIATFGTTWPRRPWCATSAACSTCPTACATASPS